MKISLSFALIACSLLPVHSQTVLEWALSETSPDPDFDVTPELNGSLNVPILGDGETPSSADSLALTGRFAPVALTDINDSVSISYEVLMMGGLSSGGTNAGFRWGLFNSNGTEFGGDQENFSGWSGALAWNSGAATTDADIRVRDVSNPERFYVGTGAVDLTGDSDFANQNFDADGVIYTVTMIITRLAGDTMDIAATLTGDNGYSLSMTGQDTANAEFTFDRVGFWSNAMGVELVALKSSATPASTDGDSIPDLEEARLYSNLDTVGAPGDLRVTSLAKEGPEITLTWLSLADVNYEIRAGSDLEGFPFSAASAISSQGGTTTHQFSLPAELVSEPRVFFVVEQMP